MRNVSFLIKPASSLCNLRCRYCFYADVAENREAANLGMMTQETSERLIESAFAAADPGGMVSFAFQGGEPTLAGLEYFRHFVQTVEKHRPKGVKLSYSLQTNGLRLDEEWAAFFGENHFLVGLSVDGDKSLHDLNRVDAGQEGTYQRVLRTLQLLKKHKADVNLLCVVTGFCARHPIRVYNALKKLSVGYLQFIPCLDPLEEARGSMPYSLKPEVYGDFLCTLFDAWYQDWEKGHYISIRLFEDYVHLAMGLPGGTCATSGSCGAYLVAEGDGSLYPCDFYVLDKWRMGRIGEAPLEEVLSGTAAKQFSEEGRKRPLECASCPFRQLCNGGCPRDRYQDASGKAHNYYCPAFRHFFSHAGERIAQIAQAELRMRHRNSD